MFFEAMSAICKVKACLSFTSAASSGAFASASDFSRRGAVATISELLRSALGWVKACLTLSAGFPSSVSLNSEASAHHLD